MNARSFLRLLVVGLVLSLAGCGSGQPTPTPPPPTGVPPAAVTPAPVPSATATSAPVPSATPTAIPTATPFPPLTATAQAFQAAVQATLAADTARLAALQAAMGQSVSCQDIPTDPFLLTSPVPFPAEAGEALAGLYAVFNVPEGTIVRAPVGGSIRTGPWGGPFSIRAYFFTIVTPNYEVLVGVPIAGSQIVLPGYDPTQYYPGAEIARGDPIVRVGAEKFQGRPGQVAGLSDFDVIVWVQTPYPDWADVPLGLSSDLWYEGGPRACSDWVPAPEVTLVPTATPAPTPVAAQPTAPLVAAGSYSGTIPAPAGQLAYVSGDGPGDIMLYDLVTGTAKKIAQSEQSAEYYGLAWSPDGSKLAYVPGYGPTRGGLVILDIASGETRQYPEKADWHAFTWSPDGQRMAFTRNGTLLVLDVTSGVTHTLLARAAGLDGAVWSPDSSQLVFALRRPDADSNEIYLLPAAGGTPQALTDFYGQDPGKAPWSASGFSWSPDGTRIAFRMGWGSDSPQSDVCTITVADSSRKCYGLQAGSFQWFPDGRRILCDRNLVLDTASGKVVRLTDFPMEEAALSPDGQFLAFESRADYYLLEIYLLHVDSGQVVARLTANFVSDYAPAWRPR